MKFGKKEKETQEEEVVRGEIQRVGPDYRVGLNREQIRIREENGWTNDEVASPGLTTKEIVHNNIFTYFNLIFLILAILLCLVGSFRNLTFLPVIIGNTLIGIIQEIRSKKVLDKLSEELRIPVGKTTEDGRFTLNATRCLGACGLAPVMMINDEVYGRLTPDEVPAIIAKYR